MSNTFTKPFPQKIKTGYGVCTAALGSIAAPTIASLKLVATAGADGGYLAKISAFPLATVAATGLVVYSLKGGVYQMIGSATMPASTEALATRTPETLIDNFSVENPKRLEAGEAIYVGIKVALAAGIQFDAEWEDR